MLTELLAQRPAHLDAAHAVRELRYRVKCYEDRYGIPSDRLHQAIEAGDVVEDLEVSRWLFQYTLLLRAEAG
jgi:hypothetical protein